MNGKKAKSLRVMAFNLTLGCDSKATKTMYKKLKTQYKQSYQATKPII